MTCLELGSGLAAEARRNLAAFGEVEVVERRFEEWAPDPVPSDMVFAATAWQWVDPAVRCQKAAAALRLGGFHAFWEGMPPLTTA